MTSDNDGVYEIQTAKGNCTGTLDEVLAWQERHQGAWPTLVGPDGESIEVDWDASPPRVLDDEDE